MTTATVTAEQKEVWLREWREQKERLRLKREDQRLRGKRPTGIPRWKGAALHQARYRCEQCGTYHGGRTAGPGGAPLVIHHRNGIPLQSRMARNTPDNLKVLCAVCHQIEHGAPRRFASRRTYQERTFGKRGWAMRWYWDGDSMRWIQGWRDGNTATG